MSARSTPSKKSASTESSDRPLVLICDDDPLAASLLSFHLQHLGCDTREAQRPVEAVQFSLQYKPACILLDCHYPDRCIGLSMLQPLHQLSPNSPVVMISADPSCELAATALQLGAFIFWHKAAVLDHLTEAVQLALDEHQRRLRGDPASRLDELDHEAMLNTLRTSNSPLIGGTARQLQGKVETIWETMRRNGIPSRSQAEQQA